MKSCLEVAKRHAADAICKFEEKQSKYFVLDTKLERNCPPSDSRFSVTLLDFWWISASSRHLHLSSKGSNGHSSFRGDRYYNQSVAETFSFSLFFFRLDVRHAVHAVCRL